jgi:hypothetical protein
MRLNATAGSGQYPLRVRSGLRQTASNASALSLTADSPPQRGAGGRDKVRVAPCCLSDREARWCCAQPDVSSTVRRSSCWTALLSATPFPTPEPAPGPAVRYSLLVLNLRAISRCEPIARPSRRAMAIPPRPFKMRDARARVREAARAAGLPEWLTLDACRRAGLNEIADADLTDAQEMAMSGHTTPNAKRRYVKRSEAQRLIAARKRRAWVAEQERMQPISRNAGPIRRSE